MLQNAKFAYFFLFFMSFSSILFSQNIKLTDREDFFLRQDDIPIYPFDGEIGLLEEDPTFIEPLLSYLTNGPENGNSDSDNTILLEKKFSLFEKIEGDLALLRVSQREKSAQSYTGKFLIVKGAEKIKGTIILSFKDGLWFLNDLEWDSQEISNP